MGGNLEHTKTVYHTICLVLCAQFLVLITSPSTLLTKWKMSSYLKPITKLTHQLSFVFTNSALQTSPKVQIFWVIVGNCSIYKKKKLLQGVNLFIYYREDFFFSSKSALFCSHAVTQRGFNASQGVAIWPVLQQDFGHGREELVQMGRSWMVLFHLMKPDTGEWFWLF